MMAHHPNLWYSDGVSSEPATRQDLADAVRQVHEKASLEVAEAVRQVNAKTSLDIAEAVRQVNAKTSQEIADAVRQVTDTLTERIRDSQTELLRGFYEWARPVDVRLRHVDELAQRMGWLENRVSELERAKLPPTH
jgi:hypothetical protein